VEDPKNQIGVRGEGLKTQGMEESEWKPGTQGL